MTDPTRERPCADGSVGTGAVEPELDWTVIAGLRSFPAVPFTLTDDLVDAYLDATGERHALYERDAGGFAPPLMATLVRLVKRSLGGRWPSGTIQLDHRVATARPLCRGETLTLDARIVSADVRGARSCFETASRLGDETGSIVGTQSSTSMWAGALAARAPDRSNDEPAPRSVARASWPPASDRVADRLGPVSEHFSLARLRAFGHVAGALDPIHVDVGFGRRSRYGGTIAQGRLVMTLLSRLMLERFGRDWLQGHELAVRFVRPVRADRTVLAWGIPAADGTGNDYTVWCETEEGETVIVGSARLGAQRPSDDPVLRDRISPRGGTA
jgi:acyl dehydratase